jgi:hypothetical protein
MNGKTLPLMVIGEKGRELQEIAGGRKSAD